MAKINKQHHKDINMNRLETWLGKEKIAKLRSDMNGWYGRPICLLDVPGSVWIHADGSFTGTMKRGYFFSALDSLEEYAKRFWIQSGRLEYGQCNAGFTSIANALARAAQGHSQREVFYRQTGSGVLGASYSSWRFGNIPPAGTAGAAAPGGTVQVSTDTGALPFNNPASGTLHLVGAEVAFLHTNSVLLYDRLFSVAKTMNDTATEAVTGVPTRYQSTTATDADYSGDNFLFMEVGSTTLANTAHDWTVCQYTNQAGTASKTLPTVNGIAGCGTYRMDMPLNSWFAPLADNDTGIKALTQMQCSAAVATGLLGFTIGHPIGFLCMPIANYNLPFDWLTSSEQAPRIFNDACLNFIQPTLASTGSSSYYGRLHFTSAAA